MSDSIKSASTARWFTGCYINHEDQCFENKVFKLGETATTVTEETLRAYPVNMNFKRKTPFKTNGASSRLGLSLLLDPMHHDQINGKIKMNGHESNLLFFLVGLGADDANLNFITSNYFDGWKVYIHEPHEFPEVARKGILIGTGNEVSIRWT